MLWFYTPPHGGNFVGTFTNRNHFAFHMTLLFAIALGLFLSSSRFHEVLQKTDWRERLEWMSTERASRLALLIFAIALMGGAICISLSRGAITSLSAAMGIVGIVSGVYGRHGILRRILWGIVLLVVAVVVWLGWQPVVGRLAEFSSLVDAPLQDSRIAGTRSTLMVLGASPVLGCGFGAFRHVFPLFQTSDIQFGRWLHAHNDWAQLLAEGGGVGGFLFILAVVFFCGAMRSLFPGAITRARLFVLGLWVGIVAVALHSLVDYSLHKPANALLLAVLCGLAVSALHLQAGAREEDGVGGALPGSNSHDPEHAADRDEWAQHRTGRDAGRMLFVRGGAFAGLVLLTFVGLAELSMLRGELAFARFRYEGKLVEKSRSQDVEKNVAEAMNDLELILRGGWGVPDTLLDSTETCFRWAIDDRLPAATRLVAAEKAGQLAASTVYVSPSDYLAWMWLARSQALLGQWEAADLSFGRARALAPDSRETVLFLRNR
jgi:O-antigen ligase